MDILHEIIVLEKIIFLNCNLKGKIGKPINSKLKIKIENCHYIEDNFLGNFTNIDKLIFNSQIEINANYFKNSKNTIKYLVYKNCPNLTDSILLDTMKYLNWNDFKDIEVIILFEFLDFY